MKVHPITTEDQADTAFSRIYSNQDEAVANMVELVAYYEGDALDVWEVDCNSFYSGRGYIILEADIDDEELRANLEEENGRLVIWNPMFQVEKVIVLDYNDAEHVAGCDRIVNECRICANAFGMVRQ